MSSGSPIGRRIAPARFILFGLATLAAIPPAILWAGWRQGVMIGFDVGAALFLLSCIPLLRAADSALIRRQARENDANRPGLLAITGIVTAVVLVAVAAELGQRGGPAPAVAGLIVGTLALSWLFSNIVYALHYAHLFYSDGDSGGGGDRGGIDFPGTEEPDYSDFLYFAATLGMTFQTSDVEIRDRGVRRVVTVHALMAFAFNIGVLAFTINVLGGG
jgi:uncharacterized membrane protein